MSSVLEVRRLSKSFPGVHALSEVDLSVAPGTVHAVMGENGAGKSTLMKILAGHHQPDAGEIRFQGHPVTLPTPHAALTLGISLIHQELMPFPGLSVAENIFMGHEPVTRWLRRVDKRKMRKDAWRLLEKLGGGVNPSSRMGSLGVAEMQTVEIAKALAHRADVIIMDEPTSAIAGEEVERLFALIGELTRRGVAIIYISHKLDEVFRIADTITVLRDGAHIATRPAAELDSSSLIALMVGRDAGAAVERPGTPPGAVALSVRNLSKAAQFSGISFDLRRGEILGLAGLMGAGRTELVSAIYGLHRADSGEIRVHGEPVPIHNPKAALRHGIGMVTEDRKGQGLVLQMSVRQNISLATLRRFCTAGFIRGTRERQAADEAIRAYNIRVRDRNQDAGHLSGGNQQKVVLAKALLAGPDILILDEPTRGIDINAKVEVHAAIARLAAEGKAILMVSSELREILALCHRVLVMRGGKLTAELGAAGLTQEAIMQHAVWH